MVDLGCGSDMHMISGMAENTMHKTECVKPFSNSMQLFIIFIQFVVKCTFTLNK